MDMIVGKALDGTKPKREWIYAKKPGGKLFAYRQWLGYTLLALLVAAPFIKIGGEPFLMFNIIDRKFVLFGNVFWPQDLHIFVFGMLIAMVCIVLFTVVYGRVWCGWACPQTIFMELVFRRIEYWIEGDWQQQKKLNQAPNTWAKQRKKLIKHAIFLLISFFISNIFLAYIIGVDNLWKIMGDPVSQHLGGFVSIMLFTLVFYAVFAYVREIVCTTVCPYGRLQGVLLDDQSITVAYDYRRGEPRGHRKKGSEQAVGDCVDCKLCVHVCPTGIDIRNGLQMECVSCTACIDACDAVMEKLDKPKKLIGFYATGEIAGDTKKKGNTRAIAYTVVLVVLMGIFGWLIFSRSQVDGTLLRAKGSSYQIRPDGTVSNLYSLELINKTHQDMPFELVAAAENFTVQVVNKIDELKSGGTAQLSFFLITAQREVQAYKTNVKVNVMVDGRVLETMKTTFVAPPGGGN
ncbi:cytochrome c oxidase accessory protein CcoG [Parapedobacter koreensis]|uniref:Cytochrome c oxidase accessory protein FixG n=1 Tax=Parapedobacter koreensis TaxID=332977 RepID=A0A1H7JMD2_9SPHI|nr:cytochrome c oxidase accessory protein CcoG [Parapedobacter koreensis]SEK75120.1 cytochrome c oxidase accessory protein FixG [Parapedobacter koreensis]